MLLYRVVIEVVEIHGLRATGYKHGDKIVLKSFYIVSREPSNVCIRFQLFSTYYRLSHIVLQLESMAWSLKIMKAICNILAAGL